MSVPDHAEGALAALERITHQLAAMDLADSQAVAKTLEQRAQILESVLAVLRRDTAPQDLCARLEQVHTLGQQAYLRLLADRESLRQRCRGMNCEVQWLRQMRSTGSRSPHSIDYSG